MAGRRAEGNNIFLENFSAPANLVVNFGTPMKLLRNFSYLRRWVGEFFVLKAYAITVGHCSRQL